jgi:hypothetical protein
MKICTFCKQGAPDDATECAYCAHEVIDPLAPKRSSKTPAAQPVSNAVASTKASDAALAAANHNIRDEQKSVRYDNIIASARGITEAHGKKVVIFVPAGEINRITLKFGRSEHRPVISLSIGILLAVAGGLGLVELFLAPRGFRYELGMMFFGALGGSLIFDTMKERYFLEVEKKNGICRLVFSKHANEQEIDSFCKTAKASFDYHIHDSAS